MTDKNEICHYELKYVAQEYNSKSKRNKCKSINYLENEYSIFSGNNDDKKIRCKSHIEKNNISYSYINDKINNNCSNHNLNALSINEINEELDFKNRPDTGGLCVENFLNINGDQDELIKKRDEICGWTKYIQLSIFIYFLLSPIFSMLKDASSRVWVFSLYIIPLSLLIWAYIEYWSRAEAWYCCICKGIILDMEKTHLLSKWICALPMYFVYAFMITSAILYALAYEPDKNDEGITQEYKRYLGAALYLMGILFMISLAKSIVDIEGAPRILSLNMFIYHLKDPKVLTSKGYKVVHFSQIGKYLEFLDKKSFGWNDIYRLNHKPIEDGATKWNLMWGVRIACSLKENKNKLI